MRPTHSVLPGSVRTMLVVAGVALLAAGAILRPVAKPKSKVERPKSTVRPRNHATEDSGSRTEHSAPGWRGVVVGPNGRPLPDAEVTLADVASPCAWPPGVSRRLTVAADGTFGFAPPSRPARLDARHAKYSPVSADVADGVVLRLPAPSFIDGYVTACATVRVRHGRREIASTDADGVFRVGPLPPGVPLTLSASAPGHLPWSERQPILAEGESLYRVIRLDTGLAVRGRIEPAVPGVTVRASQGNGRDLLVRTDNDGAFEIGGLTAGAVRLIAFGEGFDVFLASAEAGDWVRLTLKRRTP